MKLSSILKRLRRRPKTPSPLALKMRQEGLTYLSDNKFLRLERSLSEVARARVAGDFAEFGIALGGSAVVIARAAGEQNRRFLGFDVFATIPAPTSVKDDQMSRDRYDVIASGQSKGIGDGEYYGYVDNLYERVVATFGDNGLTVDGDKVRLIKGLFEDTVPETGLGALAFVHLDCDWYDPVRYCLDVTVDRLSKGGIILLDDYHDYGGCRAAVEEVLEERDDLVFEDGRNVILRKR